MSHRPWNQPWPGGGGGGSTDWADITGKPSTFTPSAHSHVIGDVTGLQSALDGKQASGDYLTQTTADGLYQPALWSNNVIQWLMTTVTAGLWIGTVGAGAGTYSTALPTTTNRFTSMKRARWANVVTTLNQVLGQRNTEAMFFRGNAAGQGGFTFYARCGMDVWTNGGRFFAGMHTATTVVSADPSALNNTVGFAVDAADNGSISFLTRGTSATKAPTGMSFASNTGFDLYMSCAPNSSEISWRIVNIATGAQTSGTATLTLPANTTMLTAGVLASNAALTTATAIQLAVNRIYVETDV